MSLSCLARAYLNSTSDGTAPSVGHLVLGLRFVKVISVSTFATGLVGSFVARDLEDRRRFAYALAGPGFGASWVTGFLLAWATSVSFLSSWVLGGLALSFVALHAVLFSVGRDGRRTVPVFLFALLPLVGTVALMVFRPEF